MDLFKTIDFYCERTDPSYWAEPINAISNLSFILAGSYFLFINKTDNNNWTKFFSGLSIVVGIGSFLFHTHANQWSLFADVVPISIFICTFLYFTFNKVFKVGVGGSTTIAFLFMAIGIFLEQFKIDGLNGSESYLHAILLLIAISTYLKIKKMDISTLYIKATIVFFISLIFRTLDNSICEFIPLGTHFLWHSLNGFLLFILIKCTRHVPTIK